LTAYKTDLFTSLKVFLKMNRFLLRNVTPTATIFLEIFLVILLRPSERPRKIHLRYDRTRKLFLLR